jgi:hypothetical protein
MIMHALFVGMVEICCSVMDAQGHFIKVRFNWQNIWRAKYLVCIVYGIIDFPIYLLSICWLKKNCSLLFVSYVICIEVKDIWYEKQQFLISLSPGNNEILWPWCLKFKSWFTWLEAAVRNNICSVVISYN